MNKEFKSEIDSVKGTENSSQAISKSHHLSGTTELFSASTQIQKAILAYIAATIATLAEYLVFKAVDVPNTVKWIALILPLAAVFLFQTVPRFLAQQQRKRNRISRLDYRSGFFRLAPYNDSKKDQDDFSRPDGAAEKVLDLFSSKHPVVFVSGNSGTGKSSILNAYVAPQLTLAASIYHLIKIRSFDDPCQSLLSALGSNGSSFSDTREQISLVNDYCSQHHSENVVFLFDQFEEIIILANEKKQKHFGDLVRGLVALNIVNLKFVFAFRTDYLASLEQLNLFPINYSENSVEVAGFIRSDAMTFFRKFNASLSDEYIDYMLAEASMYENSKGIYRPVVLNLLGLIFERVHKKKELVKKLKQGRAISNYLMESVASDPFPEQTRRVLASLISKGGTKEACLSIEAISRSKSLSREEVRAVLLHLQRKFLVREVNDAGSKHWELSHDFIAKAFDKVLVSWKDTLWVKTKRFLPYVVSGVTSLFAIGVLVWNTFAPEVPKGVSVRSADENEIEILLTHSEEGEHLRSQFVYAQKVGATNLQVNHPISHLPDSVGMNTSLKLLDLRYTKITFIPESIGNLTALQSLDLHASDITSLPESFGNLISLLSLDLSATNITHLPESFRNLVALQSLDLGFTNIAIFPESINNLTELQSLSLTSTKITSLPESIGNLANLRQLHLRSTKINSLPDSIGKLSALESLNLTDTNIADLPNSVGNLASLRSLRLAISNIERLPESIGKLGALESLYLSETKIRSLPDSIGNLISLQSLNLMDADISYFPERIVALTNLQKLILSSTQINNIPESIGSLGRLNELDLRFTKVTSLPGSIGKLAALESLNLADTNIASLPESIGNLVALQFLDLSSTTIASLPESIGNLAGLQILDLSSTNISSLPESIGNLAGLQELSLSSTNITSLPESIGNLAALQFLDLSSTNIVSLPESIGNMAGLQILDLSSTNITSLPESIGNLRHLRALSLASVEYFELPSNLCVQLGNIEIIGAHKESCLN